MPADLIIPACNEAANIEAVLAALPRDCFRYVVVVDNASTDGTGALAAQAGAVVVREAKRGYGAACLAGIGWLSHQTPSPTAVAFFDADLADDPAYLPELVERIATGQADLAIGSRVRCAQPGALTPVQRFGNALSCRLIGLLTGERFTDLGPMRAVSWEALRRLGMSDTTWGWTVEMQFKAGRLGLRCVEIDVPYRPRRSGRSKISGSITGSARAGVKILWTIARLQFAWRPRDPSGAL